VNLEKRIKIKSFERRFNPNVTGSYCAFNDKHFIDHRDECYIHPQLEIIICKNCRFKDEKEISSKFHNVSREYNGHRYHSTLESEFAKQLDLKLRSGLIKSWDKQVKIEINVKMINDEPVLTSEPVIELMKRGISAYHITNYFMDFVVTNPDNSQTFYETKGMELSVWKLKFRLTEMIFRNKIQLEVIKKQGYKPNRKGKKQ
jgi:hypothetical protein